MFLFQPQMLSWKHNQHGTTALLIRGVYRLESSANIQSVKKSLIKKDLIDVDGQTINFDDSLFKLWIKRQNMI